MSARTRALTAVLGALALVAVLAWIGGELPRRWNLVVLVLDAPTGQQAPRLEGLTRGGARFSLDGTGALGESELDQVVAPLVAAGWTLHQPVLAPERTPRLEVDANLEALAGAASPRPLRNIFLLHFEASDRAEADRQFGRLVDGLAGPLASARTLYVVVDRKGGALLVGGPRNLPLAELTPPEAGLREWLVGLMRVEL